MTHLLDANSFIEAKNLYYPFDVAPGFWDWLRAQHGAGRIASITAVRDELLRQDDELADWARTLPSEFWLEEADASQPALRAVATWAMNSETQYSMPARVEFLAAADYRLVVAGLSGDHIVVTRERPAPASKKRILIPDACDAHGVRWTSPFDVYRRLGLRLVQPQS